MKDDPASAQATTTDTSLQSGGLGLGIGVANALLYTLLPVLIAVGIWLLVSVYATVKWIGSAPDGANPVVIVVGVVLLVTLLVLLIAVAVGLVGRSMNPKRRAKR